MAKIYPLNEILEMFPEIKKEGKPFACPEQMGMVSYCNGCDCGKCWSLSLETKEVKTNG